MIDRQHGAVLIECDSCDQVFQGEKGESFADVWNRAKDEGWRTRNIGEMWIHACPQCKT